MTTVEDVIASPLPKRRREAVNVTEQASLFEIRTVSVLNIALLLTCTSYENSYCGTAEMGY